MVEKSPFKCYKLNFSEMFSVPLEERYDLCETVSGMHVVCFRKIPLRHRSQHERSFKVKQNAMSYALNRFLSI